MKFSLFTILVILSQLSFSQSKNGYLKNNSFDLLNPNFEFPKEDFKIIGFGAYHGSRETEKAESVLLGNLIENKKIKFYLPETDFGIAHYFNEYLRSGDTILLKDLVTQYGNRVPQEKSIECYNKWKSIKKLNDNEQEAGKLVVVGIDLMVTYKYTAKLLIELLPLEKGKLKSYDDLVEMVKVDTTDYSPNYESYSKTVLKNFVTEYEKLKSELLSIIKGEQIVNHMIDNINLTFKKSSREKTIFDNYVALNQIYNFKENPQFVRMGFFHIEKEKEGNRSSFFARLIENKIYNKQDVISIAGFLTKSRVLWDVKYDEEKKYTGFTTKGGYGIGDYWKEYFKGIKKLKACKLSHLTLYRLNRENSPYRNDQTDLMEIKTFPKKSNKTDLKGRTTTDYFDYAILISNSDANRPIEELNK